MTCKSLFRRMMVAVAAGAGVGLIGNALPVYAQQIQVLAASPPVQTFTAAVPSSQRLILHGVHIRGDGLAIQPGSRPVLDYAARVLQQHPETRVYVGGEGNAPTVNRQARAVAQYLESRGIAADRLVVSPSGATGRASYSPNDRGVVVLNLTTPTCATCS